MAVRPCRSSWTASRQVETAGRSIARRTAGRCSGREVGVVRGLVPALAFPQLADIGPQPQDDFLGDLLDDLTGALVDDAVDDVARCRIDHDFARAPWLILRVLWLLFRIVARGGAVGHGCHALRWRERCRHRMGNRRRVRPRRTALGDLSDRPYGQAAVHSGLLAVFYRTRPFPGFRQPRQAE